MTPLRTAILGCGNFAHKHARILAALPNKVDFVAFSSRTEADARAFSEQYTNGRAPTFTNHHTMLDQADLDLLVICLPPYAHSDEVERAAERGIHLFIEKPIALTSDHAWRMVEAAENAGIKTQVGFMFRFGEAVERVKELLDSGAAGPAGLMSARYFCNSLHSPWWRDREKSGGQLVEQVIHMVDLLRYLMGEPVTVYGRQSNLFHRDVPDYTVEDVSATIFGFASGATGVIYATNGAIPGRWINDYRLVAQRLVADFTNANNATITFTDGADRPPLTIASERDYYAAQLRDLLDAIHHNGETRTPMREGAKTLDLALAATQSAVHGVPINL
jgi:predicted dehydrogenase